MKTKPKADKRQSATLFRLAFRYDNAKHHTELPNFPHHKHTKSGVESTVEPEINDIFSEIEKEVIKRKKK